MGSSRTLNVHVPWTEILGSLDAATAANSLPARVQCPLCNGPRLTIYEDTISGGCWHYCFDCRSAGDMIELAAATWKVSPAVAVRRLVSEYQCPIPEDRTNADTVNKYVVGHPQYRTKMLDLWNKSSDYLRSCHSPVMRGLREKFRLESQLSETRWREGPGKMFGAYPHVAIEKVFCPNSIIGNRCVTNTRTFKGRGWSDIMVIPHFDLPNRICGFLFVGRAGNPEDQIYRTPWLINHGKPACGMPPAEGGLACLWTAYEPRNQLAGHVVAVADPFLALRLQIRHYNASKLPLPLVAYRDAGRVRTMQAWKSIESRVPVLWGWRLTASLVYQAIVSNGKLAITALNDTSRQKIDHYVRDNDPLDVLRRVVKKSRPWKEFLANWADESDDGAVEELLFGLESYGITRTQLADLSPRIAALARGREEPRSVTLGKDTIVERDGKWWKLAKPWDKFSETPGSLIMNATARITGTAIRKCQHTDTEVLNYVGSVTFDGHEYPVSVPMSYVKDRAPTAFQMAISRHRPDAVLYVAPLWRYRIVHAAMLFGGLK